MADDHTPNALTSPEDIIGVVNAAYSAKAKEGVAASCKSLWIYEELSSVPEGAHMGLSCGNPVATASIKEGETVVDLGSGGGIDIFLAAEKVGPTGQAIGLDMSNDMIDLARKNAAKKGLKPPQVAFVNALLTEPLPIESDSVDCVLSNCVVNLLPYDGKANLLKEVHRILKPGGRIVLDDILAKKHLPDNIKNDLASYVGCIGGAIQVEEYKALLKEAGLTNTLFVDTKNDLSVYYQGSRDAASCCAPAASSCCTPAPPAFIAFSQSGTDIYNLIASYQIYALKDGTPTAEPSKVLSRWWDAYPATQSSPPSITAEELITLKRDPASASDFAIIDVRKGDHAGGHVRGSHNWFAQSFYDDLPAFYEKFKDTPKVIFYCQSSNGRGPRSAAWYQDYLNSIGDDQKSAAFVLKGGIKNWLANFKEEKDLIDFD
ncbi:arsenite S-adenosylmethyltransferase [Gymnopilus junonius]|uniref:Arsenite methyltransferase n=1 Tax=Gymnopilus junonius TaxID=109634 RepID=A0A9P5NYE6_GYMJU|nr:arsenite S-adenosylmethyltransferase [Gymnopilus junonius]